MTSHALIVEDNWSQSTALAQLLSEIDREIEIVSCRSELSGMAAIQSAREEKAPFDIAIFDLSLPVIAQNEDLPVLGSLQDSLCYVETLWEKECGRLAETLDAAGVAMRVDKESFHHAGIRLAAVAQENPDTIRRSVIFSAIDPGEVLSHLGVAMQDDTEERSRADEPLRGVSFYRKIIDDAALQHDLEGMLSVTAT